MSDFFVKKAILFLWLEGFNARQFFRVFSYLSFSFFVTLFDRRQQQSPVENGNSDSENDFLSTTRTKKKRQSPAAALSQLSQRKDARKGKKSKTVK